MFTLRYIKHCLYDKWSLSGTDYNTHGKQITEINFYLATWTFQIHLWEFHNAFICVRISIWLMSSCICRSNINRITYKTPLLPLTLISSLPLDLSILCTSETASLFSFYFYGCCLSAVLGMCIPIHPTIIHQHSSKINPKHLLLFILHYLPRRFYSEDSQI